MAMAAYVRKFLKEIPPIPWEPSQTLGQTPAANVVRAWFLLQMYSARHFMSLESVRNDLAPEAPWGEILQAVQQLLQHTPAPANLQNLRCVGFSNSSVFLGNFMPAGHVGIRLVVTKQHMYQRGSWEVPTTALRECVCLRAVQGRKWAPKLHFMDVGRDMLQLGMEYLSLDLLSLLRQTAAPKRRQMARPLLSGIILAVQEMHDIGFAHCDLKPENIRLRSDGQPVLIDFDSAIQYEHIQFRTRQICTLGYRDPFLMNGQSDLSHYDYRWLDVFSLGVVFLFILRARPPFSGDSDVEVYHRMTVEISSGFSSLLANRKNRSSDTKILSGMMNLDPKQRWSLHDCLQFLSIDYS